METSQKTKSKSKYDAGYSYQEPVVYSEEEICDRGRIISELQSAYDQRQQRYTELDDQTYDEYYDSNQKAAAAYIAPRINKEDVKANSGTTRDKSNTLLSSLLDYDFEADVEAYDENSLPDNEYAQLCEDKIRHSRKQEVPEYDVKRPLIYKEFCDQGTVFTLERFVQREVVEKDLDKIDETNILNSKWRERVEKLHQYCDTQLVSGRNVYLGDIRQFFIELQPFVGIRFTRTRAEAHAMYGTWPRWKNVPSTFEKVTNETERDYEDWTMLEVAPDMVEEFHYFNPWRNQWQFMLNGVCMLPVGFPLSFWMGVNEYPISKGDAEPISPHFAYSRSMPAKTKVNQAVMDEFFKMMIIKNRNTYKPARANNSGQRISDKMFMPGSMTDNIDPNKLPTLVDPTGVTAPEFNMFELVKRIIDESSVSSIFAGNQSQGKTTATEISMLEKQTAMKLGLTVLGIVNLEKRQAWLRLCNIHKHWGEPVSKKLVPNEETGEMEEQNVYDTQVMDTTFDEGEQGKKILEFTDGELPESDQVEAEEDLLEKRQGQKIRKIYMNAKEYKKMKRRVYIEVVATERTTGELRKAMLKESTKEYLTLFPDMVNRGYLLGELAKHDKLDPKKLIPAAPDPMMPPMPGQQPAGPSSELLPKAMPKPSINTLMNG
jgi:hypothetical protein